jgi:circadian clock protein KaiC
LIDTWLLLRDIDIGGERNRAMYILKSRGMAHSNQIREFILTDHGVELLDVYIGQAGVLTGTARKAQEAKENAEQLLRQQEIERKQLELVRKQAVMESQVVVLRAEFEAEKTKMLNVIELDEARNNRISLDQKEMAKSRKADIDVKITGLNRKKKIIDR